MNVSPALLDMLCFTSIGLLGMGYYFKHNDRYVLRSAGFFLFGLFWALRTPEFWSTGDMVNTFFVAMALPFFSYIGFEELDVFLGKKKESSRGLEMLTGGVFFASLAYFSIAKMPFVSGSIIEMVASHSTWLSNAIGGEYSVGSVVYPAGSRWISSGFSVDDEIAAPIFRADGSSVVYIIFACTGIQSILIFSGPILYTKRAGWYEKMHILAIVLPTIYILNIIRNSSIIYMVDELGWSGQFAHDYVAKAGSLVALLFLAFLTFKIVPGILDDVNDVVEIFSRRKQRSPPSKPSPP